MAPALHPSQKQRHAISRWTAGKEKKDYTRSIRIRQGAVGRDRAFQATTEETGGITSGETTKERERQTTTDGSAYRGWS